jgi:large-conductance mechanosensitive channel
MSDEFAKRVGSVNLNSLALGIVAGATFGAIAISFVDDTIIPVGEALAEGLDFLRSLTDANLLQ